MGAQWSALREDLAEISPRNSEGLLRSLHVLGHYALIPSIYMYGLINAGEFTWNPLTLMDKILFA
jgi:uncharacterized membrane protein